MASTPPSPASASDLRRRLGEVGRSLGARELAHRPAWEAARGRAESLHALVASGLEAFHAAVSEAGAPQLRVELSRPRPDEKHLRSVQFDLRRGRHVAIVTVKSKGQVTLVGPFQAGKAEGPCQSFPLDADAAIEEALAGFLERFLEEAATP